MTIPVIDTPLKEKRYLILYHANCIDGFTSAWATHFGLTLNGKVNPKNIRLMEAEYGKELHLIQVVTDWEVDHIYVVDFSLSTELLEELHDTTYVALTLIDHHETAIRKLEGIERLTPTFQYILDTTNCGAGLAWQHLFPFSEDPPLIRLVRDYDLWIKSYPECDYINKYLRVQPKTIKTWTQLHYDMQEESMYRSMVQGGHLIQKYHDTLVADTAELARPLRLLDHDGLTVDAPYALIDDVGHILAEKSGTFGAVTIRKSFGETKYSLRSIGDFNVARIAEVFNGGGHRNAAGFTVSYNSNKLGDIKHG